MLTLSLFLTALIGALVGLGFGATIRVDCRANAEVRIAFVFLVMLCISSMLVFASATAMTIAIFFGVSTVVALSLQLANDTNCIVRLFAETDG